MRFLIVAIFIYMINNHSLHSENDYDKFAKMSLVELLSIKVRTASRYEEYLADSPGLITYFSDEQIDLFKFESINEILFNTAGFFPSQDYERITIGSRGATESWNNNHLLLMIDGVPFNENIYGSALTDRHTPLFFVKDIEVMRSSASALYGSNATKGIINIRSLDFEDLTNTARVKSGYSSYATWYTDAMAGVTNELADVILGMSVFETSGFTYDSYDISDRKNEFGLLSKRSVNNELSNNYIFLKLEGKDKFDGFTFQLHRQSWDYGTGHGWGWMIPDNFESLSEERLLSFIKYESPNDSNSRIKSEYDLRFQTHKLDWNAALAPENYKEEYPSGIVEYLNSRVFDLFSRAQWVYKLNDNAMHILFALENTLFYYNSDNEEHFSNIDMSSKDYDAYQDGKLREQKPWLEKIDNHPLNISAVSVNYSSGRVLDSLIKVDLGLRYDIQYFNYDESSVEEETEYSKSFSRFSPRFSLIFYPKDHFRVKMLLNKAFRSPSLVEMFTINTWMATSNINTIKAEDVLTGDLFLEYDLNLNTFVRLNAFYISFENETAYSIGGPSEITNIFSTENIGIEAELFYESKSILAFANLSYVKRIDEEVAESQTDYISENKNELTWAPALTAKAGIVYRSSLFEYSLKAMYQGEVKRRDSDYRNNLYSSLRPKNIDAWINFDLSVTYNISNEIKLNGQVRNIFDTERHLIKILDFPFDYRMNGRTFHIGLNFNF